MGLDEKQEPVGRVDDNRSRSFRPRIVDLLPAELRRGLGFHVRGLACNWGGHLRLLQRAARQQRFDEAAAVSSARGRRSGDGSGRGVSRSLRRHEDDNAIVGGKGGCRYGAEKCGKTKSGEATHACLQWAERGFTMHRGDYVNLIKNVKMPTARAGDGGVASGAKAKRVRGSNYVIESMNIVAQS